MADANPKAWRLSGSDAGLVRYPPEGVPAIWYEGGEDHVVLESDYNALAARVAELEAELSTLGMKYAVGGFERDRLRAALKLSRQWRDYYRQLWLGPMIPQAVVAPAISDPGTPEQALAGQPVETAPRPDAAALTAAPELKGKNAVVLYFDAPEDRDEVVAAIKEAKPNMRAVNVR